MPEFPYQPDPKTDFHTLYRQDRRNRRARDLGSASITRGEGSMDLYESDDGPVVGRYGDLPDGSFGVGLTHRGAFWNVSDLIGQGQDHDVTQDGRLGAAEGRLDGHDGRLDGHASRIGTAEGRLDSHAGRLGSAEGRLDSHAGRIGAAESKNTAQDGRLDDHASRIGAVEGDAGSLGTRISNAEGRLDDHASRIGANENGVSAASTAAAQAAASAAKIINCINQVGTSGARSSGGMSTMAEPTDWQQLKNCLAS